MCDLLPVGPAAVEAPLSMAPSPGTSTKFASGSSLTLENLESLPKITRAVDKFVEEQRQNARFYAREPLSFIDQPLTSTMKGNENVSKPKSVPVQMPLVSPPLRSRLEMQKESSMDPPATPPAARKSKEKELFKNFKHVREENIIKNVTQKPNTKTKRPQTPSDDEHARK